MKTRNGLFADVPENLWNDWHWQVANRAETIEDLKKYMNLTPMRRPVLPRRWASCVWQLLLITCP